MLEALAAKIPTLIRDIPIYEGWFEDGVNVYKARELKEFNDKIKKILEKELPPLTEAGYRVAQERDIKNIGKELLKVYNKVLEEDVKSK